MQTEPILIFLDKITPLPAFDPEYMKVTPSGIIMFVNPSSGTLTVIRSYFTQFKAVGEKWLKNDPF